jgi:hypothetical protein
MLSTNKTAEKCDFDYWYIINYFVNVHGGGGGGGGGVALHGFLRPVRYFLVWKLAVIVPNKAVSKIVFNPVQ